jgi:DNA-binding NtrC family response regulator
VSRNGSTGKRLSPDAAALLQRYSWDGNIRELENAVLGAVALADDVIYPEHLSDKIRRYMHAPDKGTPLADSLVRDVVDSETLVTLSKLEEKYVTAVLEKTGGNKQAASRILGIDRKTLVRIAERANEQVP